MSRSFPWLLFGILVCIPLFGLYGQVVKRYNANVTYREVTPGTDGCNSPLCHYHKIQTWGNDAPMKEFAYRGMDGLADSAVLEFMNWRMLFPVGYDITNPAKYPMIIMLHGSGESGRIWTGQFNYAQTDVRYDNNDGNVKHGGKEHQIATGYSYQTGLPSGPVKFPGIVVWPQVSYNASWETGWNNGALSDNNRMATQIIEYLIANWNVDPDRISIHGLSNGAQGGWDLAAKRPDLFAAFLPMSGVATNYNAQTDVLVTTPIWLFQGGIDTNPNPQASLDLINMLITKGGNPIRTVYPTLGHGTWTTAYAEPNFFPFMLAANKKDIYVFGGDPSVCPGGTLRLGVSAGYVAYQWTRDDIGDIPGATTRYYNVTQPGTYRVRMTRQATVAGGETITTNPKAIALKLVSNDSPLLTNTGSLNLTVDLGGALNTVTLNAPLGYSTYDWYKDHNLLASSSTNTKNISNNTGVAGDAGVYTVKVLQPTGCKSSESNSITVYWNSPQPSTPKPDIPTLAPRSSTSIQVNWNSMPGEAGFEIWKQQFSTSPPPYSFKGYALVAVLPANTNSYLDQTARPAGKYKYRVRALHSAGGATFSDDSNYGITPADGIPPTSPTNLVASNILETQVTLTWDPSSDNDKVYKYEIYSGSTPIDTLTGGPEGSPLPVTSITITGLTTYSTYTYSVRARDYAGNYSPFSDNVTVTTAGPPNGLNFKYYKLSGSMPGATGAQLVEPPANNSFDFNKTPTQTGTIATFDVSGAIAYQGTTDPNNFVYAFDGYIDIPAAGNYRFYTRSDDGSRLYINGALLVNNDGFHAAREYSNNTPSTGDITLLAGKIPIRVTYFEGTVDNSLTVSWERTNNTPFAKTPIPAGSLFLTGTSINNYYLVNTGTPDPSQLSSWTSNPDGSAGGSTPLNFTDPLQYFIVANQSSVTLGNSWTVSGGGSKVIVGNGGSTTTELTLNAAFSGIMEALKNGVINVNNSTMPTFGVLDAASTVNFNIVGAIPSASYGNVNLQVASQYTFPLSTTTIQGNLAVVAGATTTGIPNNLSAIRIGGNISFANTGYPFPVDPAQEYALVFTGGKTHTVSFAAPVDPFLFALQADFNDSIVFNNSGLRTYTFGSSQGGGLILKGGSTLNLGANNIVVSGLGSINPNNETGAFTMNGGNFTLQTTGIQNSNIYFNNYTGQHEVNVFTASTPSNTRISILSQVNIRDLVTLTGGELNSNDGSLTLLSDATGTASIGTITNGARITGSITTPRYMDGGHGKVYRYISSSVKGATVAMLQQTIPVTGNFQGTSTGLGSNASMFSYTEPAYMEFPANGTSNQDTMRHGKGYALYVREPVNPTSWTVMGTPNQGTISFVLTAGSGGSATDGWNLLGNPYPSPIQWSGVVGTKWPSFIGISQTVYVRENMTSTSHRWRVYNPNISTLTGDQAALLNGVIAPGQAFWVQAGINPALSVAEAAKYSADGQFYRTGATDSAPDVLGISLSNGTYNDVTYLVHDDLGNEKFEKLRDAVKQPNSFFNLSTLSSDGISLVINVTPRTFCQKDIQLDIANAVAGSYSMSFLGLESFQHPVTAVLKDNFTGNTTEIKTGTTVDFTVTTDVASSGPGRFVLTERPMVLTNAALKSTGVCESNPSITLLAAQPNVQYHALFNGVAVSDTITSTGTDSVTFTLDRKVLGYGTHTVNLTAGFPGCQGTTLDQAINVRVDTLQTPSIAYQSGGFLVASPPNADHYQWLLDGSPLKGKTDATLVENNGAGNYQVRVSSGACSKVSTPFDVTAVESDASSLVKVYPNPFHDQIVVTLPEKIQGGTATLINPVGQRVQSISIAPQDSYDVTLNFSGVEAGPYVLSVGRYKFKVIKIN